MPKSRCLHTESAKSIILIWVIATDITTDERSTAMFKMTYCINTNLMEKDGMNEKFEELESAIKGIDSYIIESSIRDKEGNLVQSLYTQNFGDESFLISLLEDMPWFLKYVKSWETDDNGKKSDMIDVERDMGVRCSYAV